MAEKKLDRWKSLITEWQESGITREVFCRERDLKISTFSYWRTKINKMKTSEAGESVKSDFIRYNLSSTSSSRLTIEWPDGMKLQLPVGINLLELAGFIVAIRGHR